VELSADLLPDIAGKPYNYGIDFGDGTILSDVSSLDPLLFTHTYSSSGVFTVQIWVWNAGMIEPVTDTQVVHVSYKIFLPVTAK
jgi:PKD repeat protein